jgi:pimeloyl-ACP methyl ester carboxylesterase
MDQDVRFCAAPDGARLAYSAVGEGPTLVKAANWLTHLEFDWESPIWRGLFLELSRTNRLVRYDTRGNGLSDHDVPEITFETMVQDLETVVEAVGAPRFSLLGISQGCAVSIAYAVRHPERVERLVLYGGYSRGWAVRGNERETAIRRAMQTLIREGWGKDNPAFRQVWASLYLPDGTPEQMEWFRELQRRSTTPDLALRILTATSVIDVRDLLPRVAVPTLVLHAREDGAIPFEEGRSLAAGIPGARFVQLESRNHIPLEHEPAWREFLVETRRFLGVFPPEEPITPATAPSGGSGVSGAGGPGAPNVLGPYRLLERIGTGGMGSVWRASDERLHRTVAIKLLHPSVLNDTVARRRLLREARALASLDHPNVASVHQIEVDTDPPFLVLGFVEGATLADLVKEAPIAAERVVSLARGILAGLGAAHERGIVHRDLKPANIMVGRSDAVKLVDFGLAGGAAESELTPSGYVVGTPAYMSPEQALGAEATPRSDLFSIGVVLFELLTGVRTFQRETMGATLAAIVRADPCPFPGSLPVPTLRLEPAIRHALRKDPAERPATAAEMLRELEDAARAREA